MKYIKTKMSHGLYEYKHIGYLLFLKYLVSKNQSLLKLLNPLKVQSLSTVGSCKIKN